MEFSPPALCLVHMLSVRPVDSDRASRLINRLYDSHGAGGEDTPASFAAERMMGPSLRSASSGRIGNRLYDSHGAGGEDTPASFAAERMMGPSLRSASSGKGVCPASSGRCHVYLN